MKEEEKQIFMFLELNQQQQTFIFTRNSTDIHLHKKQHSQTMYKVLENNAKCDMRNIKKYTSDLYKNK